jgi:hypothetical protein
MKAIVMGLAVAAAATLAACAPQRQGSQENQLKQEELKQLEQKGQRNDIDKIRIN